jgi:teichuronic acid biosynthesis glycosyltransferase TuaG
MSVSVIIPCFNSSKTIERAVKSVMAQSYQGVLEVLIIDDASSDDTILKLFELNVKFKNIKILKNNQNMGPGYSRNKGIDASRFNYIAFLDADDFWLPDKLKNQIEFMEKNNYDFTYHDYYILYLPFVHGIRRSINYVIAPKYAKLPEFYYLRSYGMCLTSVIRKKAVSNIRFSEDRSISTEDYFFFLGLLRSGVSGVRLPIPLGVYTISGVGRSTNKLTQAISVLKVNLNYSSNFLVAVFYFAEYICVQFFKKLPRISSVTTNTADLNYINDFVRVFSKSN